MAARSETETAVAVSPPSVCARPIGTYGAASRPRGVAANEWPRGEEQPAKYRLSTPPTDVSLTGLVRMAKHRWIIERDYLELRQEFGLGHLDGRGWRGFHHHATLCLAACQQALVTLDC